MTHTETTYSIELTLKELEMITTALHGQYKTEQELYESSHDERKAYFYEEMGLARSLRNEFARLTNRCYMGEDA